MPLALWSVGADSPNRLIPSSVGPRKAYAPLLKPPGIWSLRKKLVFPRSHSTPQPLNNGVRDFVRLY
jgi:hypothetical protein